MIDVKITMASGKVYVIRNPFINNQIEFIKSHLMPYGTTLPWYQVSPGISIQPSQIEEISIIKEEENESFEEVESELQDKDIKVYTDSEDLAEEEIEEQ